MAERRMMSKKVIHGDDFMDLPATTKNLYFYLMIEADDDGFVNSPKRIQRMINSTDDDAKLLIAKKFIISFESGIIVVKHWRMHNYIRNDRYKETTHLKEKGELTLKDTGTYSKDTIGIPSGSIGKDRLGKDRLGKDRLGKGNKAISTFENFIKKIEVSFSENRISTFRSKINKTSKTKEAFNNLKNIDECGELFVEYVKRLRNIASRLDIFILAYIEGNLEGIEHTNNKFNTKASPQEGSLEWERQQTLKQQREVTDAELI